MPKIKMNHPSKTLTLERAFQEFKVSQAAKGKSLYKLKKSWSFSRILLKPQTIFPV